jgi:hypothetical protein
MGKVSQNASSLKPLGQLKPNCPGMIIGRSSTKFMFFYADQKSKMAATAGNRLTLDPMGKCSNAFFSETTIMIKTKLQVCSLNGPLQTLDFLFRYEIQNGGYDRTKFNIGHLGIPINIKNTKFVKDLPMIDAQFRFNQCNSFREENISVFSHMVLC